MYRALRPIWVALAAAVALSGFWMSEVPDYIYRQEIVAAASHADSAFQSCRSARVEDTVGLNCDRVRSIAFDAALDPIMRLWPQWGPILYAFVALILVWAIAAGFAFTIDWLRRGVTLWRSA